ncbi:MAG: hypothetical protein U0168_30595 [Nannocystaceae bacterium]
MRALRDGRRRAGLRRIDGALVLAAARWCRGSTASIGPGRRLPHAAAGQEPRPLRVDARRRRDRAPTQGPAVLRVHGARVRRLHISRSGAGIGLLNMGSEPTKGGETLVEAHRLLQGEAMLNFTGNIEGNDIPAGKVDVVVCEGLLGNVTLKMAEGTGELFRNLGRWAFKQSLMWKLGLLLLASDACGDSSS